MQIILSVKNFGKIEEASVNIGDYTIFVGNNNSGKTYMMQLIYGVIRHIKFSEEEADRISEIVEVLKRDSKVIINSENMKLIENAVNDYLEKNKDNIVYGIFQYSVQIEELKIEFILDENEDYELNYEVISNINLRKDLAKQLFGDFDKGILSKNDKKIEELYNNFIDRESSVGLYLVKDTREETGDINVIIKRGGNINDYLLDCVERFNDFIQDNIVKLFGKLIYLPASRTGMLLLRNNYFASKVDKLAYSSEENDNDELGVTTPVYEFLRFGQTKVVDELSIKENQELINFIDENIIEGHIDFKDKEHSSYIPLGKDVKIPLFLASSMVNEISPIEQILIAKDRRKFIILDEIETSLHPSKQVEMARLLNRMINHGYRLIVSTHSDTMASKINNLLLLSYEHIRDELKKKKLDKLNLSEEDLLHTDNVHVYQFVNLPNGKSKVEELKFQKVPYIGYDFSQFSDNLNNLYEESKIIMGLDE